MLTHFDQYDTIIIEEKIVLWIALSNIFAVNRKPPEIFPQYQNILSHKILLNFFYIYCLLLQKPDAFIMVMLNRFTASLDKVKSIKLQIK